MWHIRVIFSLFVVITALNGCASLSKEECLGGDWERIGYKDGAGGRPTSHIYKHRKACADYKIAPDISAYQAGRSRGLEQIYCKPRNGYKIGLSGRPYNNVCPSYLEADFLDAYRYGVDIHHHQKDAKKLHSTLDNIDANIQKLDQEINQLDTRIHSHHTQRGSLRSRIRHHIQDEQGRQVSRIENKIQQLDKNLHLNRIESHALKDLTVIANRKGIFQNRLSWYNQYGKSAKPQHRKRKQLRDKIDDLDREILRKQETIRMSRRSHKQRKNIIRLLRISEYSGELDSQLKILQRLENRNQVKNLIQFHIAHVPDDVSKHSDRHLLHEQSEKSIYALRSELRNARLERDRLLLERHDVEHNLNKLEQDIEYLKRANAYR